jgi:glycosidase
VNELDQGFLDFIAQSENSVVRHWLRKGASGWRLDVADELPDAFIAEVKAAARLEKGDSFILGEVWENSTNKISYGHRRRYLWEGLLDGVMNYPFRSALIAFLLGGTAEAFMEPLEDIRETYPPEAFYSCMNFLSSHDTPRILTVLGASAWPDTREARAQYRLSAEEYALGKRRLLVAASIMFTFPGAPAVFYGDEAGMQGFEDPFNRGSYPWGHEDEDILSHFRKLAQLRKKSAALRRGSIKYLVAEGEILAFSRNFDSEKIVTMVNAGNSKRCLELCGKIYHLSPISAIILEE